jgi:hypothetical protein
MHRWWGHSMKVVMEKYDQTNFVIFERNSLILKENLLQNWRSLLKIDEVCLKITNFVWKRCLYIRFDLLHAIKKIQGSIHLNFTASTSPIFVRFFKWKTKQVTIKNRMISPFQLCFFTICAANSSFLWLRLR